MWTVKNICDVGRVVQPDAVPLPVVEGQQRQLGPARGQPVGQDGGIQSAGRDHDRVAGGAGAPRARSARLPRPVQRGRRAGCGDHCGPGRKLGVLLWPFKPPHTVVGVVERGQQDRLTAPFPSDPNAHKVFPH